MKSPLLVAAMILSLAGCSEKQPEKPAAPAATSPSGLARAAAVRPAVIQSTLIMSDACALDGVNDQPAKETSISAKGPIKLSGWAGIVSAGISPKQVFVELEGPSKAYIPAALGIKRQDVADHFKKPGLADTGWEASADLSDLAAGTYKVRIIQIDRQTGLVCDSNKSIVIK